MDVRLVFYARKSQACQWKEMPINGSSQPNPCLKKTTIPWRICLKWRLPGLTPSNQFSKQGLITCILTNFHGKSDTSAARPHLQRSLQRSALSVASCVSTIMLCKGSGMDFGSRKKRELQFSLIFNSFS